MSPTVLQLARGARKRKVTRARARAFEGAPQRKGVVYKVLLCHRVNLIQQKEPS